MIGQQMDFTMPQMRFDMERAAAAGEAGMRCAERHASQDWKDRVNAAILTLAVSGREFIADDIRKLVGDPPIDTHPNALGALVNRAARAGHIQMTGYGRSAREIGHRNTVRIWRGVR